MPLQLCKYSPFKKKITPGVVTFCVCCCFRVVVWFLLGLSTWVILTNPNKSLCWIIYTLFSHWGMGYMNEVIFSPQGTVWLLCHMTGSLCFMIYCTVANSHATAMCELQAAATLLKGHIADLIASTISSCRMTADFLTGRWLLLLLFVQPVPYAQKAFRLVLPECQLHMRSGENVKTVGKQFSKLADWDSLAQMYHRPHCMNVSRYFDPGLCIGSNQMLPGS